MIEKYHHLNQTNPVYEEKRECKLKSIERYITCGIHIRFQIRSDDASWSLA